MQRGKHLPDTCRQMARKASKRDGVATLAPAIRSDGDIAHLAWFQPWQSACGEYLL